MIGVVGDGIYEDDYDNADGGTNEEQRMGTESDEAERGGD